MPKCTFHNSAIGAGPEYSHLIVAYGQEADGESYLAFCVADRQSESTVDVILDREQWEQLKRWGDATMGGDEVAPALPKWECEK